MFDKKDHRSLSLSQNNTETLQDRGVDLSFDMVKKENFEAETEMKSVKTENCDLRVKSENLRSDTNQTNLQSPSSKLGGGRLKFYKGESRFKIIRVVDDGMRADLLVWKMFVKKREFGRREEKREGSCK